LGQRHSTTGPHPSPVFVARHDLSLNDSLGLHTTLMIPLKEEDVRLTSLL
jgi:hypothetical protein